MCEPKTLIQAIAYFSDSETCNAYMRRIKWPDGKIACPHCEAGGDRIAESKARPRAPLRCRDCGKQFSYKVGTIFESSNVPLSKWFVAVWLIANSKNGISSHELGRAIGVTQRTAWFMLHRIRYAMQNRMAKKATKKPKGWGKFDALARKLARVPKDDVDAAIEADRKKRKRRRKK